jgi:hypothetical protein
MVQYTSGGSSLNLPGATAATRYAGGTVSGAPVSGTFAVGDFIVDETGLIWICTVAGTPGTWANAGASAGVSTFNTRTGAVVPGNADYLAVASGGLTGAVAATRFAGGTASGAPASGTFAVGDFVIDQTGDIWICTVAGSPGTWVDPVAEAVQSVAAADTSIVVAGTATAPTIRTGTLDVIAAQHPPAAAVAMNSQNITGLAAPVNPGDAVTKAYADAISLGLSIKPSVQEATTAALPANVYNNGASGVGATLTGVSTGVLTVDGQAVALNDRVLVKNEAAPANNGIYTCTTAGAIGVLYVLTRATDMNQPSEIPGAFAFVENGTVNGSGGFVVAASGPYTIGTTAITWTQFSGAGEITAGAGLVKAGNTLSLGVLTTAGDLIIENATPAPARLAIGSAGQSLQVSSGLPAWATALTLLASTGAAGYTLVNGTGTVISYTFPNDGLLHRFTIFAILAVSSAETGGTMRYLYTSPDGTSNSFVLVNGGAGGGITNPNFAQVPAKANTTVSITQGTALTGGAAVLYAEIWGS